MKAKEQASTSYVSQASLRLTSHHDRRKDVEDASICTKIDQDRPRDANRHAIQARPGHAKEGKP